MTTQRPIGQLKSKVTVYCETCGCSSKRNLKELVYENTPEKIKEAQDKLKVKAEKEYRKDGSLMYECTKRFLNKNEEHLFDRRIGTNGSTFIRINQATKYKEDGTIQWRLIYNDKGDVIGNQRGALRNPTFS